MRSEVTRVVARFHRDRRNSRFLTAQAGTFAQKRTL